MCDGIESFEVTDWDLENEFNPDRVRHKLTKKQQIYGVFASDDSEEEDARPGFGLKNNAAYSGQISFISGGVRTVGEKDETKKASDQESVSSGDETPVRPSPSYQRNKAYQRSGFSGGHKPNQMAGFRSLSGKSQLGSEFGSWEKYTKGIGQKLLQKMGYESGKGLGKNLQGITTPIETKRRLGKGAIGLYGPESGMRPAKDVSRVTNLEQDDDEKKEQVQHKRQWKKKDQDKGEKIQYVYRTVEDVREEGSRKKMRGGINNLSSVKVIDMTGPEQRILSGYHQIHQQHAKPPEQEAESTGPKKVLGYHFSLPELEHNLKLLEEEEKKKIVRCEQQRRFSSDQIIGLNQEEDRLHRLLHQEEKQIKTLEKVLDIVECLETQTQTAESNTTLEMAAKTFKELQEDYYEEYKMYHLSDLAITIVVPLAKSLMENWDPLNQKHHCIDVFKDWKDILEMSNISWSKGEGEMDPYTHLVWQVWMPPIRKAILNWRVRDWKPMVDLLETWIPLLPAWVLSNVLEQLVLPRLHAEVENWNPLTDTVPIHSWLHPWLGLMGPKLEPLYGPIRQKLSTALVNWHPSDCSAKLILEPWKSVFSQGIMGSFVVNNIVPKLVLALQTFLINPHQQHLDVWNWVMTWLDMIPEPVMVTMLEKNFFPRWLQVLYSWLAHNPNYEEVTKWYMGWKTMMPPSLLLSPIIKDKFKQALDIMNQAVSPQGLLASQPGAKESMAYLTNVEMDKEYEQQAKPRRTYEVPFSPKLHSYPVRHQNPVKGMMQTIRTAPSNADISLSFKDLIQKKAEESNILFMPIAGRYQQGKQVHRFGSLMLYLDRGVIFVFNDKTWVPTSLQSLLDMAG